MFIYLESDDWSSTHRKAAAHKVLQRPFHLNNILTLFTDEGPVHCLTSRWLCCLTSTGRALPSAAMSAKAISEQTGKEFLYKHISASAGVQNRFRYANVTPETDWDCLTREHPWLLTEVSLSLTDTRTGTHGRSDTQHSAWLKTCWYCTFDTKEDAGVLLTPLSLYPSVLGTSI